MFHLPNNPPWNLLVKAVRWILAFLVSGIITFPAGEGELSELKSIFAFTGTALYFNTAWPDGSAYVKIWPCGGSGGPEVVQLPTEGGAFISAQRNDNDGSPGGNWYEEGTGKTVYFRPDTGLNYIWEPYTTIQLPGAVEWITVEYKAMQNGFITQPGFEDVSWAPGYGWYYVLGATTWRPIQTGEIPVLGNSAVIDPVGIALRPKQFQGGADSSGKILASAADGSGNHFSAGYADTVNGLYPINPMPLVVKTYEGATNRMFIYSFDGAQYGFPDGWAETVPYGEPGYPAAPIDGPDLSGFAGVSVTVQKIGGQALTGAEGYLLVQE